MNFLQRAGAILMLLAIFASSCNKYADDFTQINTKLDALATQVAGVTTLSTDISALKSQFTALQTSIAALPSATAQTAQFATVTTALTAMDAKITALTTTLNTVAATGTATKAVVDGLKTDLAALAATVAANNTTAVAAATAAMAKLTSNSTDLAALKTQLTTLAAADAAMAMDVAAIKTSSSANTTAIAANAAALATLATQLTANNTAIMANNTAIAANLTAIAANSTSLANIATSLAALATAEDGSNAATAAAIAALQVSVTAQKTSLDQILANTSMYTGAVTLASDADVDFFMLKISQMNIINGSLSVNPTLITKTLDLNTILKKVTSVVGTGTVTVTGVAAKPLDLSSLTSASGNVTISGGALVPQAAVDISKLSSVSGNFSYDLDGAISLPMLSTVGGTLTLPTYATVASTSLGTLSVDLSAATVVGVINAAAITFSTDTKSVIMPATGLTTLSALGATTLTIVNTPKVAAGLGVSAKTTASTVDMTSVTEALGALTVNTCETAKLPNLAKAGGAVTVNTTTTGTVNLDKFNANVALTIGGAKAVSLPVWAGGNASKLVAIAATTISLPAHTWSWLAATQPTGLGDGAGSDFAAVKVLTVGNVNSPINTAKYTTLTDLTVTGKTVTTWATLLATLTTTAANSTLKNVTIGGLWKTADLTGLSAMTSLTTTGAVINGLTISGANNASLTSLTLAHTGFSSVVDGTPGAMLVFNGANAAFTSLTATNLDKVVTLAITGNTGLTTLSLPACVNLANNGVGTAISIVISGNGIRGAFTPAVAANPGVSPYVEAVITCPTFLAMKTWLQLACGASGYATKTYDIQVDNSNVTPFGALGLVAAMGVNDAVSSAIDQTAAAKGIDVLTEIGIIQ